MRSPTPEPLHDLAFPDRTPEEIEQEIDDTRQQLHRTLDALHSRFSPQERLRAMGQGAVRLASRISHSADSILMPSITGMIRLDHTHVLALFRRYKATTSATRKHALAANACLALKIHAQLEEEIFYPALKDAAPDNPILGKSVHEHDEMRALIDTLRNLPVSDPAYDRTVWTLMHTVLHHVADEESTLLPLAESRLAEQLRELGRRMTKRRVQLLGPHWAEAARTSALSFPAVTTAAAVGAVAIAWLLLRPRKPRRSELLD